MFAQLGSLTPLIKPLNLKVFAKMLMAKKLFLVTFDDEMWAYTLLVLLRAIIGRKTAGLSLRAQSCFDPPKAKALLKKVWFKGLKYLPNFTLLTPVPYSWRPNFETISNGWIYDPQFWDLYNFYGKVLGTPEPTEFSSDILAAASGRPIVMFIGSISRNKGFDFFQKIAHESALKKQGVFFVAAGRVLPDALKDAQSFERSGGLLVNRFISDLELGSLYGVSDLIWACYAPSYNQTSGVFGRALQLSVPMCVRESSLISEISDAVSIPHIKLFYDSPHEASEHISNYVQSLQTETHKVLRHPNIDLLDRWANHSKTVILSTLGLASITPTVNAEPKDG